MTKEDVSNRGNLLYVAEFLSSFQAFFRKNDADRKGPISVESIERALRYRERLLHHYALENELLLLRKDGFPITEEKREEWETAVKASKDRIESSSATDKAVFELLRRFEVWSTQALANDVLTYCVRQPASSPSNGDRSPERICCSSLLNLPGAAHLLAFIPGELEETPRKTVLSDLFDFEGEDRPRKDHLCGLALPPNAWTWQEYLRISSVVSLLRDPVDASRSTLTAASPSLIGHRREELKLTDSTHLTPADLVALWTRAQRNTSAFLHLLHLFKISEAPEEPKEAAERFSIRAGSRYRGKVLVLDDTDMHVDDEPESVSEPRYVAHYIGNHKSTRKHVINVSKHLDELVGWAVTNQVLFTYRYIREGIIRHISPKKRQRTDEANGDVGDTNGDVGDTNGDVGDTNGDVGDTNGDAGDDVGTDGETSPSKRRRIAREDDENLLHACQCYVLRWFARRNRDVVSVLFASKVEDTSRLEDASLFPYQEQVKALVKHNVPKSIKRILKEEFNSHDRTLARIDRRILVGKYDGNDDTQDFREAVLALLNALASCCPAEILSQSDVEVTCRDFEILHDTFLTDKTAPEAAKLLLNSDISTDEDPAELLLSLGAPWEDRCFVCEGGDDAEEFIRCDCCDQVYHKKCAGDCDERSVVEIIKSYKPLAKMFALGPPIFSSEKTHGLEWTRLSFDIKKERVGSDGKLQSLGIAVRQTEDCEDAMNRILSKDPSLTGLALQKLQKKYPLKVDHHGVLIVNVLDGEEFAGLPAGLKPGDIVTEVSVAGGSHGTPTQKRLETLTSDERLSLLTTDSTEVTVTVQRPNLNLFASSWKWVERLQMTDDVLYVDELQRRPLEVKVCSNCRERTTLSEGNARSIQADARWCQALIRSLSMEPYTLSYHNEPRDDHESNHADKRNCQSHVSLRRLDAMMDFIASKHGPPSASEQEKKVLDSTRSPFMLPPSFDFASADDCILSTSRVSWATPDMEQKPMELLCQGIDVLLCRSDTDKYHWETERVAPLRRFLALFSAWFLYPETVAPNTHLPLRVPWVCPPWVRNSCVVCRSRAQRADNSEMLICDREGCRRFESSRDEGVVGETGPSLGDIEKSLHRPTGSVSSVDEYDQRASLVGIPVLVLPGDPMLQQVSKDLYGDSSSIGTLDRPTVFLVASYLPRSYVHGNGVMPDKSDDSDDGMFHLLPVLTDVQMKFLLSKCSMRRPNEASIDTSWTELSALRLEGVIRLSTVELMMKLKETTAISAAIDIFVRKVASMSAVSNLSVDHPIEDFVSGASEATVSSTRTSEGSGWVDQYSTLIDSVLQSQSPFVRSMIGTLCPDCANADHESVDLFSDVQADTVQYEDHISNDLEVERGGRRVSQSSSENVSISARSRQQEADSQFAAGTPRTTLAYEPVAIGPRPPVGQRPSTTTPQRTQFLTPPLGTMVAGGTVGPRFISHQDLYRPSGLPGMILTRVETAFLIEADVRRMPILGLRLLCPRYHIEMAVHQQQHVRRADCSSIPKVQGPLWDRMLQADYDRSRRETGEPVLHEGSFHYCIPSDRLPLDRLTEKFLHPGNRAPSATEPAPDAFADRMTALANAQLQDCFSFHRTDGSTSSPPERWPCPTGDSRESGSAIDLTAEDQENEPLRESRAFQSEHRGANATLNAAEAPVDRIRGGGPSVPSGDHAENGHNFQMVTLADSPRERWQNSLVHSNVDTTQHGDDAGEATIIGVVNLPSSDTQSGEEEVPLSVFYVSSLGYIDQLHTMSFPATDLFLVREGSEEYRIAHDWEGLSDLMESPTRIVSDADDDHMDIATQDTQPPAVDIDDSFDRPSSTMRPDPAAAEQICQNSPATSAIMEGAMELAESLCRRRQGATVLGELPDGRAVLWLRSDPCALYVRTTSNNEVDVAACRVDRIFLGDRNDHRQKERYFCPWGCSRSVSTQTGATWVEALPFASASQLREHLQDRHDFGLQGNTIEMGAGGSLYRISEDETITALSVQLKTAICKCLVLRDILEKSSSGTSSLEEAFALNPSEILDLISDRKKSSRHVTVDGDEKGPDGRRFLLLWSRIARLFTVESSGMFRVDPEALETRASHGIPEKLTRLLESAEDSHVEPCGCLEESLDVGTWNCRLCGLRLETATESKPLNVSPGESESSTVASASCSLLCQLCRPDQDAESRTICKGLGSGPVGVARVMLIRLALCVPDALRRVAVAGSGYPASAIHEQYLWEEGHYQNWRYLVERSRDARAFLQAFSVLIRSVKTDKLPRWWKGAREGWQSAFTTMTRSSFSGLFLHLYAFDAALSEYLTSTQNKSPHSNGEDYLPEGLRGLTAIEQMAVIDKWADEVSFERFEGEYKGECLRCQDGGDLVCCNFCANVQHAACCQPPIDDPAKLATWACLPCVMDIATLYSVSKDGL